MFCTSCGTKNIEESNYCKQCGHKLDRAVSPRISEAEFDRALPEDEQVTALLERAYRARKDGDSAEAIRLCEEALHLKHESTSAHSLLGQLYEQAGDRERAIREYERVLRLNPGSIADRVKLDELRSDLPAVPDRKISPHIVLAERQSPNEWWNPRVWGMLAAGVALMLLGGILAMQMRPHEAPRTNLASLNDPGLLTTPLANVAQNNPPPANTGAAQQFSANPLYPSGFAAYPLGQPQQQPTINNYYPSSQAPRTPASSKTPPSTPDHLQGMGGNANADGGGERTRLPDEGSSEISINVGDNGNGSVTPTLPGKNGGGGPKSPTAPLSHIDISPGTANGTPSSATGADSRAAMAIADDKFMQGDYHAALENYRKALSNAGDERAYVFQRMATCFQRLADKPNAVTYYRQAVEEYQKQVSAGRNVESAQIAIKACQSGINVCSK